MKAYGIAEALFDFLFLYQKYIKIILKEKNYINNLDERISRELIITPLTFVI